MPLFAFMQVTPHSPPWSPSAYQGRWVGHWAAWRAQGCRSGPGQRMFPGNSSPGGTWGSEVPKERIHVPEHLCYDANEKKLSAKGPCQAMVSSAVVFWYLSEMSVAKAASLARMLQERAEPSRLFRSARLAMILQMLRTERQNKARLLEYKLDGHSFFICLRNLSIMQWDTLSINSCTVRDSFTYLWHWAKFVRSKKSQHMLKGSTISSRK